MNKNKPNNFSALFFICGLIFSIGVCGCTAVLIGGATAAGVIAVSQDSATTSYDVSFQRAWKVASEQIKKLGEVDKSFQKLGELRGKIEGSNVTIKVSRLTEKTVDIKVTARKNLLPNPELAQAILASIIRRL